MMTALKLDTLSARINAHKNALIHIVKPPVCTERAQHYTQIYQENMDKPMPVRRALALAYHLANRTIWIKHDELIVGNQASEVRAAPIFPEYSVSWIEKRSMTWRIVQVRVSLSVKKTNGCYMRFAHGGVARPYRIAATVCLPTSKKSCWPPVLLKPKGT